MKSKPKVSKIDNAKQLSDLPRITTKPRDIIMDRRKDVAEKHFIFRKSIREIARELGNTPKTIWSDLQYLKKHFKEQPIVIDKNDLLGRILFQRNYNMQKLAELRIKNQDEENASEERLVIKLIEEINSQTIKDLQELQYIDKPKERSEIEHKNYEFTIKHNYSKPKIRVVTKQKTRKSLGNSER